MLNIFGDIYDITIVTIINFPHVRYYQYEFYPLLAIRYIIYGGPNF